MNWKFVRTVVQWEKVLVFFTLAVFILATSAPPVAAEEKTNINKEWKFGAEVYLWGASVGGKTASGSNIDVSFDDVLENLEMGFMGLFGVQKGRWSLMADVIYLDVKDDTTVSGQPLSAELSGWIVTPAVGYNLVETERVRLDVVGGARYLYLELDLGLGSIRVEESGSIWDAIVGVRGSFNLTEKWYLPYHLDVGTGDSDLTWQAVGGVGYKLKWFDVLAGYRYLYWDFEDGKAIDDLDLSGPFAGIKFVF